MFSAVAKAIVLARAFFLEHYPEQAVALDGAASKFLEFEHNCERDGRAGVPTSVITYADLQTELAGINEKSESRKKRGVYYTPADVVDFIIDFTTKVLYGKQGIGVLKSSLSAEARQDFCLRKTTFDPTCGAGEFLVGMLERKIDLLSCSGGKEPHEAAAGIIGTIYGNDSDPSSVAIAKLRMFLVVLDRFGPETAISVSEQINSAFTTYDFVDLPHEYEHKYDVIIGNPPYVEDKLYGPHEEHFGNVYCNVLVNACRCLNDGGAIGFILPLSYVSTPRMRVIRERMSMAVPCQYILSYADRPDSLFAQVHQKLCILIGRSDAEEAIYTSNYQYWYKEERSSLFENIELVINGFENDNRIPKLGNEIDMAIFKKVVFAPGNQSLYSISRHGNESVYLNRRETFWIKAFREPHIHPEFKVFSFETAGEADYCYCLVNSSLFWWYWISVSDCWHVSRQLNGFMCPACRDYDRATLLASALIRRLEETKIFVGTKQTDYEYKHVRCLAEIEAIDDFVSELYGLSEEECAYIKGFAMKYRTGQGAGTL